MPLKYPQRVLMEEIAKICYKNQIESDSKDPEKKSRQLIFSNTHYNSEFLMRNIKNSSKMKIDVHRGGLAQDDRTLTEMQLSEGEIDAISCTPTLELGIDIGSVDVVISTFTHKHDTFIQRSGRAGRQGKKSYTFCVFEPKDASCQYYSRNIREYIDQIHKIEINKNNPIISAKHEEAAKIEEDCITDPMHKSKHFQFLHTMNMRGSEGNVEIKLDGKNIGNRGIPTAYFELHEKALYPRKDKMYEVVSLENDVANIKESNEKNKATRPIVNTRLTKDLSNGEKYGKIEIRRTITGYYKGDNNKDKDEWAEYPATKAFSWSSTHMARKIVLHSKFIPEKQGKEDPGIHTIIHVFANAAKLVAKCEPNDIEAHYDNDAIYLFDNSHQGANGVSQIIDENFEDVIAKAKKLLNDCNCDKQEKPELGGCPRCTHTTGFCSTNNKDLKKSTAREYFDTA